MKYFLLILITFLTSFGAHSQELEGIWISISRMDVLNNSVISLQPDSLNKYTDGLTDSVHFSHYGFLLEFSNSNKISYGNIGSKLKTGNYLVNKDTVEFQIETSKIKAIQNQNKLTLLDLDRSKWQNSHIIFEQLSPTSSIKIEKVIEDFDAYKYWNINTDSLSSNFGMDLFLIDSSHTVIYRHFNNFNSETTSGLFQLERYKNDLFLHVLDEHSLNEHFYRIFSKKEGFYLSQSFEQGWYEEEPTIHITHFSKNNLPTPKELKSLSKMLIGNWKFVSSSFPFDSLLSEFDSIVNTYYYCSFSKNKFEIEYGGELLKDDQNVPKSVKYKGDWKIGRTGKFLELYPENDHLRYLTIVKLNKNEAIISMATQAVDDEWIEVNKSIELRKGANKR